MSTAGKLFSAVVSDAMGLAKIPGGSVAGLAIDLLFKKRLEAAREILLQEIGAGQVTLDTEGIEEAVAILYRYMRAAQEGAARRNLRLLAKVIAGRALAGTLTANEFLYHADIIASLRREEILLLATLYKHWRSKPILAKKEEERSGAALIACERDLIPNIFKERDELVATAGAITRTGLLIGESGWDGAVFYRPSPLMDCLNSLAPFEAASDS